MKQLWLARYTNQHNPFGGRILIGYAGWHEDQNAARDEAKKRYPDVDPAVMAVERA